MGAAFEPAGLVRTASASRAAILALTSGQRSGVPARQPFGRQPPTAWRQLQLPAWLGVALRARKRVDNEWNVVFPPQHGKLRDRSNTSAGLRDALHPLGYQWMTSNTFRKTAATLLNDGGLTVREVADQLGHSRVSITQDVYFGRAAASRKAAEVVDALGRDEPKSVGQV